MSEISPAPNPQAHPGRIDRTWDDEEVLPAVLSPDTEFVFRRMTEETLKAARPENGGRLLDVGCGRAIDAVALASEGGAVLGCEPSRVMLRRARERIARSGARVSLVSSLGEGLPFAGAAFHRVVCKGAIDHFLHPEDAVAEMSRVAAREGRVVISVANFESLSCILSRGLNRLGERLFGRGLPPPRIWEIPRDHTYKFDGPSLRAVAGRHLKILEVRGVSLLWGFPRWSRLLQSIPRPVAGFLLRLGDQIASWRPSWSDVLILTGKPLKGRKPERSKKSE